MQQMNITYKGKDLCLAVDYRQSNDHLLLFLHGLGCSKECFDSAFKDPGLEKFSMLKCDFVGFGLTDKPKEFTYTLEDQAEVISIILAKLKPVKVSIIAHSMGGAIGLLIAEKFKELDWFISIEGNLVGEDCGLVSRGIASQTAEEFENKGYFEFLAKLEDSNRHDFNEWAKWYRQSLPYAVHESAKSLVDWSDSGELLRIFNALPKKAYIYGDEDPRDYLIPQLQSAQTIKVSNAGHFSMIDNSTSLYGHIADFLKQN